MTPMIDVVFLLIIFFLVSNHLSRQESSMDLPLPVAASGDEDLDQTTPRVTINLRSDGTLTVGGREIGPQQLTNTLNEVRQKEGDEVEVRIRGSRQAPYSAVEPILLACTDAKIWNVTFAVYREEQ